MHTIKVNWKKISEKRKRWLTVEKIVRMHCRLTCNVFTDTANGRMLVSKVK